MPPNYTNIISISRHKKLSISSPKLILFFMSVRKKGKKRNKMGSQKYFFFMVVQKERKERKMFFMAARAGYSKILNSNFQLKSNS